MTTALDARDSLFGLVHEDVQYKLTIAKDAKSNKDAPSVRVASFRAVESLSELFTYKILVGTEPDSVAELENGLGREATFAIEEDGRVARVVHGIITDVMPDGAFIGKNQARVLLVLEPTMANLRHSGGFRIFQNMPINEIVEEICKTEQIECFWNVLGVPPKREYCTQLDESDLEFIKRIASEEGMHFYFQHDEAKTKLVFANDPGGYQDIDEKANQGGKHAPFTISFNDTGGAVSGEHVRSIRRMQSVRVGAFEHRDYDPLSKMSGMGTVTIIERAETEGEETPANSHKREVRDYPGRFTDQQIAKELAKRRLDELRSDAAVIAGTASSHRLTAGKTFTLEGHREDGFNQKLLVTHVRLDGAVQGASRDAGGFRASTGFTSFSAVPAKATIHPKRMQKPPSRLQSARVVGPKDGDPHIDEHGRIKVRFFWDRLPESNKDSSCWIRMMTPVAHRDEGFWQVHKVGSEVLVDFIDGDIDRPVILGAIYNKVQVQPNPLPVEVAKSTWKTRSIPGNAGFNEITQDNSAGKEEIYLHAQKNLREVVLANHKETIGANQSSTIGANRSATIGANETVTIAGKRTERVTTGEDVFIRAGRTHTIETGDDMLVVKEGNRTVDVQQGKLIVKVKQLRDETIEAGEKVVIKSGRTHTIQTGDDNLEVTTGSRKIGVKAGNHTREVAEVDKTKAKKIELEAAEEIIIKCGDASISLKKDGTIKLEGTSEIFAKVVASSLKLEPAKATLNGGPEAEVLGGEVKVNA
ncbi:type VI secretion system tip protein VgrG [Pendulispora brunnea]|uniref:Type VI secretion system tip protein VgrG n=1 Tax=Pendulispora brunnea TaxID=2905690 RepID=A0ABZ2K8H5_9BACT